MTSKLIIMRHGQSLWTTPNVNRFAGWIDVPLSEHGKDQAKHAGELIMEAQLKPEIVITSLLKRSITSANIALDTMNRLWIPVQRSWRLNERHYGAFQGQTRPAMLKQYGNEAFNAYRRSYNVTPPLISTSSPNWQVNDPRYNATHNDHLDTSNPATIRAESLKELEERFTPYWYSFLTPLLREGTTVFVVTHGSVVRTVIKLLENISEDDIRSVNVPTGIPLVYDLSTTQSGVVKPTSKGTYLDPVAAQHGIAQVEALGKLR